MLWRLSLWGDRFEVRKLDGEHWTAIGRIETECQVQELASGGLFRRSAARSLKKNLTAQSHTEISEGFHGKPSGYHGSISATEHAWSRPRCCASPVTARYGGAVDTNAPAHSRLAALQTIPPIVVGNSSRIVRRLSGRQILWATIYDSRKELYSTYLATANRTCSSNST